MRLRNMRKCAGRTRCAAKVLRSFGQEWGTCMGMYICTRRLLGVDVARVKRTEQERSLNVPTGKNLRDATLARGRSATQLNHLGLLLGTQALNLLFSQRQHPVQNLLLEVLHVACVFSCARGHG